MNNSNPSNVIVDTLQQGFRITIGATASLVETLQDPQKRQLTAQDLQQQWGVQAERWSEKGSQTESEARQYVDQLLVQLRQTAANANPGQATPTPSSTIDFRTARDELEALTQDIVSIKEALSSESDSDRN